MIVLPGLVETHWHMWNTLLRSMAGDRTEHGYFPTARQLGEKYLPGDMYQGTRLVRCRGDLLGHDHRPRLVPQHPRPEYADEDLRALRESGIRARFSYGAAQGQSTDTPIDTADIGRLPAELGRAFERRPADAGARVARDLHERHRSNRRRPRGARTSTPRARSVIPISVHANNARARAGAIAVMAKEKCPRPGRAGDPRDLG